MNPHLSAVLCFLTVIVAAAPANAGGAELEALMGDKENGAPFFGEARDVRGWKPLEGVRIRAQLKGQPLPVFVETNEEGRFSLRGFGKGVDPDNVDIKCDISGYNLLDLSRRRVSRDADAATEIECLFEKK